MRLIYFCVVYRRPYIRKEDLTGEFTGLRTPGKYSIYILYSHFPGVCLGLQ